MKQFRYTLKNTPGKKPRCPACGKEKFVRYFDLEVGEFMPEELGRCDRENNCGYHYTPKQYFQENPGTGNRFERSIVNRTTVPIETKPISYLPFDLLDKSVRRHEKSCLYKFLARKFTAPIASRLHNDYFVGVSSKGNTTFWQVDFKGQIREGKVIQYNSSTGKRNKDFGAYFIGKKILNDESVNLQQCFFGESLLNDNSKPVAIVESEKTAVIASVYFPQYVWLATGGKRGAKFTEREVCRVLSGRNVVLFPDVKAFDEWKAKSELIANVAGCKVVVSDLLHNMATDEERVEDCDIADYLLRNQDTTGLALTEHSYPVIWDY